MAKTRKSGNNSQPPKTSFKAINKKAPHSQPRKEKVKLLNSDNKNGNVAKPRSRRSKKIPANDLVPTLPVPSAEIDAANTQQKGLKTKGGLGKPKSNKADVTSRTPTSSKRSSRRVSVKAAVSNGKDVAEVKAKAVIRRRSKGSLNLVGVDLEVPEIEMSKTVEPSPGVFFEMAKTKKRGNNSQPSKITSKPKNKNASRGQPRMRKGEVPTAVNKDGSIIKSRRRRGINAPANYLVTELPTLKAKKDAAAKTSKKGWKSKRDIGMPKTNKAEVTPHTPTASKRRSRRASVKATVPNGKEEIDKIKEKPVRKRRSKISLNPVGVDLEDPEMEMSNTVEAIPSLKSLARNSSKRRKLKDYSEPSSNSAVPERDLPTHPDTTSEVKTMDKACQVWTPLPILIKLEPEDLYVPEDLNDFQEVGHVQEPEEENEEKGAEDEHEQFVPERKSIRKRKIPEKKANGNPVSRKSIRLPNKPCPPYAPEDLNVFQELGHVQGPEEKDIKKSAAHEKCVPERKSIRKRKTSEKKAKVNLVSKKSIGRSHKPCSPYVPEDLNDFQEAGHVQGPEEEKVEKGAEDEHEQFVPERKSIRKRKIPEKKANGNPVSRKSIRLPNKPCPPYAPEDLNVFQELGHVQGPEEKDIKKSAEHEKCVPERKSIRKRKTSEKKAKVNSVSKKSIGRSHKPCSPYVPEDLNDFQEAGHVQGPEEEKIEKGAEDEHEQFVPERKSIRKRKTPENKANVNPVSKKSIRRPNKPCPPYAPEDLNDFQEVGHVQGPEEKDKEKSAEHEKCVPERQSSRKRKTSEKKAKVNSVSKKSSGSSEKPCQSVLVALESSEKHCPPPVLVDLNDLQKIGHVLEPEAEYEEKFAEDEHEPCVLERIIIRKTMIPEKVKVNLVSKESSESSEKPYPTFVPKDLNAYQEVGRVQEPKEGIEEKIRKEQSVPERKIIRKSKIPDKNAKVNTASIMSSGSTNRPCPSETSDLESSMNPFPPAPVALGSPEKPCLPVSAAFEPEMKPSPPVLVALGSPEKPCLPVSAAFEPAMKPSLLVTAGLGSPEKAGLLVSAALGSPKNPYPPVPAALGSPKKPCPPVPAALGSPKKPCPPLSAALGSPEKARLLVSAARGSPNKPCPPVPAAVGSQKKPCPPLSAALGSPEKVGLLVSAALGSPEKPCLLVSSALGSQKNPSPPVPAAVGSPEKACLLVSSALGSQKNPSPPVPAAVRSPEKAGLLVSAALGSLEKAGLLVSAALGSTKNSCPPVLAALGSPKKPCPTVSAALGSPKKPCPPVSAALGSPKKPCVPVPAARESPKKPFPPEPADVLSPKKPTSPTRQFTPKKKQGSPSKDHNPRTPSSPNKSDSPIEEPIPKKSGSPRKEQLAPELVSVLVTNMIRAKLPIVPPTVEVLSHESESEEEEELLDLEDSTPNFFNNPNFPSSLAGANGAGSSSQSSPISPPTFKCTPVKAGGKAAPTPSSSKAPASSPRGLTMDDSSDDEEDYVGSFDVSEFQSYRTLPVSSSTPSSKTSEDATECQMRIQRVRERMKQRSADRKYDTESKAPPIFKLEVHPLKRGPSVKDLNSFQRAPQTAKDQEEEMKRVRSLKYFLNKADSERYPLEAGEDPRDDVLDQMDSDVDRIKKVKRKAEEERKEEAGLDSDQPSTSRELVEYNCRNRALAVPPPQPKGSKIKWKSPMVASKQIPEEPTDLLDCSAKGEEYEDFDESVEQPEAWTQSCPKKPKGGKK